MYELQQVGLSFGNVSFRSIGSGKRKILFFHGFPGSSLQIQVFEKWLQVFDLEVLCFDRPGYNRTDIHLKSGIAANALIAENLMDRFGWEEMDVFTVSGGTPAGLYSSARLPERVRSVHVISGLGALHLGEIKTHFPRTSLSALKLLPWIPGFVIQSCLGFKADTQSSNSSHRILQYLLPGSEEDQSLFVHEEVRQSLQLSLYEALFQKAKGPKLDAKDFLSSWGAELNRLKAPVHFWHGENDQIIPFQIAKEMSARVANSSFNLVPNEGHFSLPVRQLGEILNRI
jgi:pimeloyl-ACP methyl ester carboxylesterase